MTFIDALIVVLLVWAAYSGLRQGLIVAGLSLIGAVTGAIVALRLAPLLMGQLAEPGAKVAIGIACVIVGVGLGELAGSWLGGKLSKKVTWRPAVAVDRALGLIGHTFAIICITWLVALPLAAAPVPWLSSAVRGSSMLNKIDRAMPSQALGVSDALSRALGGADFPSILSPLGVTPTENVPLPDPQVAGDPQVQTATESVLKVLADAPACGRGMEGTGFVIAPERLMTNAHVVAGAATVQVEVDGNRLPAQVVTYDAQTDIAVLAVPGLGKPALRFDPTLLRSGSDAVIAGYPLNGPLTVLGARISTSFDLRGPDIYGDSTVQRNVYTLRGVVRPGNSGGPLLTPDGVVVGVIFGTAPDVADVGYALTGDEVKDLVAAGSTDSTPAATGACVPTS